MKILVCISKAPDTTTKITFKENGTVFNEDGVQFIVNPYDEWYALVRALELKESLGGNVTIITVGSADIEAVMRKALAIGADDAVRIDANPTDAFFTATQIADYAKNNAFDIVMLGKETINYNGSQVGGMVAELLDWPYVSNAVKMDVAGTSVSLERDVQTGEELIDVDFPVVISAAKGMAEQRIPNMRGIMAARTKPLKVVPAIACDNYTSIDVYELPAEKAACKFINPENMDELVNLLKNEAKVL